MGAVSDEDVTREGGCLCGAVRFAAIGDVRGVIACHCEQCRRTSGHHVAATNVPRDRLTISDSSGALRWFKSSEHAERGFCGTCGGNLFYRRFNGGSVSITAGTFDQPSGLKVIHHIYVASKSDYYEIADDLPKYAIDRPGKGGDGEGS